MNVESWRRFDRSPKGWAIEIAFIERLNAAVAQNLKVNYHECDDVIMPIPHTTLGSHPCSSTQNVSCTSPCAYCFTSRTYYARAYRHEKTFTILTLRYIKHSDGCMLGGAVA
jgi:hypothetical protein